MSIAHAPKVEAPPVTGGCAFLSPSSRSARCSELAAEGFLVARVVPVHDSDDDEDEGEPTSRPSWHGGPLKPGGLGEALEGAVEISLALRGALPPAVEVGSPGLAMARDQLYRVRTLQAKGLCVVLPSLRKLADGDALGSRDSEALRVWQTMTESGPVWLLFDEGDRDMSMLAPAPLAAIFGAENAPPRWADDARDVDPLEVLDGLGMSEDDDEDARDSGDVVRGSFVEHDQVVAQDDDDDDDGELDEDDRLALLEALADADADADADDDADDDDDFEDDEDDADHEDEALAVDFAPDFADDEETRPFKNRVMAADPLAGIDELDSDNPRQGSLFEGIAPAVAHEVERFASHPPPPPEPPPMPADVVQRFCLELEDARGPKPVKAIESLFRTRYAPLAEAIHRGLRDDRAMDVVEEWRESFEHSYHEGFNTMKVTGRRPTMVLDAPEVAARIGKLNGARTVQLLLVDAMRYDLGQMVQAELKHHLASHAVCVEETLMWSALPAVTPVQMRLLARGAAGLKDPEPQSERDPVIQRDGSVTTLRRVRIGHRDLVKLDVVEARLREAGRGYHARLSALAEEVSDVIANYTESLPPKTLLYIFGDHGFTLPIEGPNATGPAEQGGATPEEVLMGGWAWLVGDAH